MTETRVEADVEKEAIKTEFKKQVFIPGLRNPGSALFWKAGSGSALEGKAGSASAFKSKFRSFRGYNWSLGGPWTLT